MAASSMAPDSAVSSTTVQVVLSFVFTETDLKSVNEGLKFNLRGGVSTWVLKTRLIRKKDTKFRFRQSIENCGTIPKM